MSDDAELPRWRQAFELRDDVLYWRQDPTRSEEWNAEFAGQPVGERVRIGGGRFRSPRIVAALKTGVVPRAQTGRPTIDWAALAQPAQPDQVGHPAIGGGPLVRAIDEACAETGLNRSDLTVLHKNHDPFTLDNARGHVEGRWFKEQFEGLVAEGRRLHLRGIHYLIASVSGIVRPPYGQPYINTFECWKWLVERAAKCARWLDYVPFDAIDDARNEARYHRIAAPPPPSASASGGLFVDDLDIKSAMPTVLLRDFTPSQKYAFVVFGEKSSLTPVLDNRAVRYSADLYIGAGELSHTLGFDIAKRAAADGRILVCFTVTDFDPSGWQMSTSIARTLRALKVLKFPSLQYRVRQIGLTLEQAVRHNLPSTPLKEKERRAANWVGRFGREQTEIDALMAMRPGELEREVDLAFAPYWDHSVVGRAASAAHRWQGEADQALVDYVGAQRLAGWRARYADALQEIEAVNAEQAEALEGFDHDPPELPEAKPSDEPDDGDIASSAWSLAEESLALKARKALDDEDDGADGEEGE